MPSFDRAGCPLYYEVDGEGPAIVFAHGAGGNHLSWWQQVPEFRDSYRCVALDQRGFGRSLVEPGGEDPSPEAFRLDLVALLDELAIEKSALVAQSPSPRSRAPNSASACKWQKTTIGIGWHSPVSSFIWDKEPLRGDNDGSTYSR